MSANQVFPRIQKLPDEVANQIAAGEVIERPASVVKELIENSIDAAANNIFIDVEQAGISLIRVRDDGQGIHKDDLCLALEPHATSKISSFPDLEHIASLGFRGEAIPSIASVSRFKLTSRLENAEKAWSIDNDFKLKPAVHETGTTVEVEDLFFSTPGRRKFLKSERTEFLHIQALIRSIALSHFSTGIFFQQNQQPLFRLPACNNDLDQRVLKVCGKSFLNKSIGIDAEKEGLRLWGWLGLSDVARSQTDRQYFYVNGRMVRDKHISHAIRLAYDDRVPVGRHAAFVLHLQLDPTQVDVNVHPAKSEVRFSETRNVHDFVYSSLLDSLNKSMFGAVEKVEDTLINEPQGVAEAPESYRNSNRQQTELLATKQSGLNYIVLSKGRYVIATIGQDHYLIDVYQADVRNTECYLLEKHATHTIKQRPVLVPVSCQITQKQMKLVLEQSQQIQQWGFELEQISPDQILIRSIPARLVYADAISLVKDLLASLSEKKSEKQIAKIMAGHVNDAGMDINESRLSHLLNDITSEKNFIVGAWRHLDKDTLKDLLDKK